MRTSSVEARSGADARERARCLMVASQVSARYVTAAFTIRASGVMAACIEGDSTVGYLEMNACV